MGKRKSPSVLMPFKDVYSIEVCQPLDKVASIIHPKHLDSPAYVDLANRVSDYCFIICHWIAYEIHPYPDIYKLPYIQSDFQAFRTWGKLFYAHLKLCQVCWEGSSEIRDQYRAIGIRSPWEWWISCMFEFKTLWADADPNCIDNDKGKTFIVKSARYILTALRGGYPPTVLTHPGLQNNLKLCKVAQRLRKENINRKKNTEFNDFWNLFLNAFQRWIEDFRKQPFFACIVDSENKSFYRDSSGHWQPMPIPDECKFKLGNLVVFFDPPWSEEELYINLNQ